MRLSLGRTSPCVNLKLSYNNKNNNNNNNWCRIWDFFFPCLIALLTIDKKKPFENKYCEFTKLDLNCLYIC